ncbi:MAG: MATE family efflux transporter [Devosiaceae bacterium]|nr:MATE family efflux transporter [Devosiaceae bacterium MH13]
MPSHAHTSFTSEALGTVKLAVPIVVGLASSTLIGVVDTIMIAPLGTQAMAGAALTTSALVILYSALYGLMTVIGIEMANRFGAGDTAAISRLVRNGSVLALIIGALTALLMMAAFPLLAHLGQPQAVLQIMQPYWISMAFVLIPFTALYLFKGLYDAIERPWIGTAFAMLGVVVNVPFNWVLIHGVGGWGGFGLLGAGLASFLAEAAALFAASLFWRFSRSMRTVRQPSKLSLKLMLAQLREGSPVALAYTGEGSSYAFIGIMLGWFGASALAANQIVGSIGAVIYMLPLGMAAAVGIRIGQASGGAAPHRIRVIGISAFATVATWMLMVAALILLLRDPIASALSDDPAVIAIASAMFLTVALMQLADGVQSTALGALRGLVDNRIPSLISLIAYWPVALPLAYLFGFTLGLGPAGVWAGYGIGLALAALALTLRFLKRSPKHAA